MPNTAVDATGTRADETLAAIHNGYRRAVLRTLADADEGELAISTLVARVVDRVHPSGATDERRRQVHTALHHVHLPKLADSGLIDYDAESGWVRSASDDLTEALLSVVDESESKD